MQNKIFSTFVINVMILSSISNGSTVHQSFEQEFPITASIVRGAAEGCIAKPCCRFIGEKPLSSFLRGLNGTYIDLASFSEELEKPISKFRAPELRLMENSLTDLKSRLQSCSVSLLFPNNPLLHRANFCCDLYSRFTSYLGKPFDLLRKSQLKSIFSPFSREEFNNPIFEMKISEKGGQNTVELKRFADLSAMREIYTKLREMSFCKRVKLVTTMSSRSLTYYGAFWPFPGVIDEVYNLHSSMPQDLVSRIRTTTEVVSEILPEEGSTVTFMEAYDVMVKHAEKEETNGDFSFREVLKSLKWSFSQPYGETGDSNWQLDSCFRTTLNDLLAHDSNPAQQYLCVSGTRILRDKIILEIDRFMEKSQSITPIIDRVENL